MWALVGIVVPVMADHAGKTSAHAHENIVPSLKNNEDELTERLIIIVTVQLKSNLSTPYVTHTTVIERIATCDGT